MRAGFVAVPVNYRFPRKTIHFIIQDCGAKLVFCDTRAAATIARPDLPAVVFGGGGDGRLRPTSSIPARSRPWCPKPGEPAMFLYTSGSTGTPKGVVLSHQSHIWVVETRLAPGLDRHRYLIAAPLYHMNALALAKLACAAHATIVLLPRFEARAYIEAIAPLSPDLAHRGAADDRDDAARAATRWRKADLSSVEFIRMGSAPVSASLMAATHTAFPKATVTNAYGTTEAGPIVFGPHPKGLPQPEASVGYPHPKVAASPGRRRQPRRRRRACWR